MSVIQFLRETETEKIQELQRENKDLAEKLRVVTEELNAKIVEEQQLRANFADEKNEMLHRIVSLSSVTGEKLVTVVMEKARTEGSQEGRQEVCSSKRRRSSDIGSALGLVFGVPSF